MKKIVILFLSIVPLLSFGQKIITDDVDNFWNAYDKIILEKDSLQQLNLIKTLYIDKGTAGLDGIMRARRYTAEEYVYAINHYPKFWNSVRNNTLKNKQFSKEINNGIKKLKKIYPELKPVNIYFAIGILRTGGTTIDGMLLIGSEVALTDKSIITSEFENLYPHLRAYFDTNPINSVSFLNVHEYIHTQQKETIGNTLLSQTIMEGVAEFLAEVALGQKSPNPQIEFGYKNEERIKQEYEKEMFSPDIYNWIMNNPDNQFGMRDLGYFVGYAICKKYYEQSSDKKLAVKEMIELDYNNEKALISFVEKTGYFDKPLSIYKSEYESKRPKVIEIQPIKNNSQNVDPNIKTITLTFSEEMNPNFRNFELGPLGENNLLRIAKIIGFSEDNKSFTFEANLEPDKQYQILINYGFRSKNMINLIPYLIDFKTAK
ncbi:DUF2268 domain-containing putative Zn-dependent protease [Chryseobacterium salipaludis]|uniref:gliding motility protein GldB-related protein n=1 Tax=Chryseobacterium TaxID=59732 RepID=UPI001FF2DA69|nr:MULTISPECIES: DUF2268 domain-containing putative Zn-dependent protease [Chryseobacterium]MCJ8498854.1 DUF2268 domain-containing putative Zn-dependent protease [Chryseobacterium salipaludis]MCX3297793.1 DUF2268 domain-containing putative Zn-dependent protease [Planobacterium sp. JC490]